MLNAKTNHSRIIIVSFILLMVALNGFGQISPGELTNAHANLEGMTNCTKCHTFGEKISNDKCLACHKEIKERIDQKKGYHSSSKVVDRTCVVCHSEHHGRNFEIIHFDIKKFDHNETGFNLEGVHTKKGCADCHKPDFIADPELKKKKSTYLGLINQCFTCHEDRHQKTLSNACLNCHTNDAFKPATKFDHSKAKYQLIGKHSDVTCIKCHKKEIRNGKDFQQFTGIQYKSCANCHKDVHENQFGQNCVQCHSEESFKAVKGISNFDHSKTGYLLTGRHIRVACKSCHKISLTTALPHEKCTDCHADYHKGQFSKAGKSADCTECHTGEGFTPSLFTIEKHNQSKFKLEGGHLSTPCFECHKKEKDWNFRKIGEKCVDCHQNIHKNVIDASYFPEEDCEKCHNVSTWNMVKFDHNLTTFKLEGKHSEQTCRKCHFEVKEDGTFNQKFSSLKNSNCENCHTDIHQAQFRENNQTACLKCHGFTDWKPEKFNHDNTRFKLDGKHKDVSCLKCHKEVKEGSVTYRNYKIKDIKCTNCHSQ
jgi:nitrate/TMAO reductase-like tetraheme cytochrome c subunit